MFTAKMSDACRMDNEGIYRKVAYRTYRKGEVTFNFLSKSEDKDIADVIHDFIFADGCALNGGSVQRMQTTDTE